MLGDNIREMYFSWLSEVVDPEEKYSELLELLHNIPFRYLVDKDENRMKDGEDLRYQFASDRPGVEESYLNGPCTVLEMIVALCRRCEVTIMDNFEEDRTSYWFECMLESLGLKDETDEYFDESRADDIIQDFLDRRYEPNGEGGLFTIPESTDDLRTAEIFDQMCWWLNTII